MPPKKKPAKQSSTAERKKKPISFDIDIDEALEEMQKPLPKIAKKMPSTKTSGLRTEMKDKGVPMKCAITGFTHAALLESAHIYPKCWIDDGTFAMSERELKKKFLIEKDRPLSLDKFVPSSGRNWKAKREELLTGISNRMLLFEPVHTTFDGKSDDSAKLGRWTLVPKTIKDKLVPHTYAVVVKPSLVDAMKDIGVEDRSNVVITHVDPRLILWHAKSFFSRCPTAGAEYRGDDNVFDDKDDLVHPDEMQGQADLQRQFLDQDQATIHHREPIAEHVGCEVQVENPS